MSPRAIRYKTALLVTAVPITNGVFELSALVVYRSFLFPVGVVNKQGVVAYGALVVVCPLRRAVGGIAALVARKHSLVINLEMTASLVVMVRAGSRLYFRGSHCRIGTP